MTLRRPTRKRVLVDLDGVVYDFHSCLKYLVEAHFGVRLPPVDELFDRWDGHKRYLDTEMEHWLWTEGVEKYGLFRHGHVLRGAIDGLNLISQDYDIIIGTHRPPNARQDTLEWIAFNRIPCKEVVLLWNEEPKSWIDADVIIDDKPENVVDFIISGRYGILWSRPWNRDLQATVDGRVVAQSPLAMTAASWSAAKAWMDVYLSRSPLEVLQERMRKGDEA